jgi:hypothetical protein
MTRSKNGDKNAMRQGHGAVYVVMTERISAKNIHYKGYDFIIVFRKTKSNRLERTRMPIETSSNVRRNQKEMVSTDSKIWRPCNRNKDVILSDREPE